MILSLEKKVLYCLFCDQVPHHTRAQDYVYETDSLYVRVSVASRAVAPPSRLFTSGDVEVDGILPLFDVYVNATTPPST
jgi:hypothetical protein